MNTCFHILAVLILLDTLFTFDSLLPVIPTLNPNTTVIFIKTVPLPEGFIIFAWKLASTLCSAPTTCRVAVAILLSATAILAVLLNYVIFAEIKAMNDLIQDPQFNIISANKEKDTILCKPNDPAEQVNSLDFNPIGAVHVQSNILSCPNEPACLNCSLDNVDQNRVDIEAETATPDLIIVSQRRLSFADTVVYSHIQTKKPRNPYLLRYADISVQDLFFEPDRETKLLLFLFPPRRK